MATANRYAWSAKQAVEDAKEGLTKAAEKLGGGGGADMNNLPSDPTRVRQAAAKHGRAGNKRAVGGQRREGWWGGASMVRVCECVWRELQPQS